MVERVAEMADAVVAHLQRLAARHNAMGRASAVPLKAHSIHISALVLHVTVPFLP